MTSETQLRNTRKKITAFFQVWFWKNQTPTEDQVTQFVGLLAQENGMTEKQIRNILQTLVVSKFLEKDGNTYKCIYKPTDNTVEKAIGTEEFMQINTNFKPSYQAFKEPSRNI